VKNPSLWRSRSTLTLLGLVIAISTGVPIAVSADTTTTTPTTTTTTTTTTTVHVTTTTVHVTTTTVHKVRKPKPTVHIGPVLVFGDHGPAVLWLQHRLATLHYWTGGASGVYADSTQQAVWAFQKVANLPRDGVVGPLMYKALARGAEPKPHSTRGITVEVDLKRDLVLIVKNGNLKTILNTSTGGGYTYTSGGVTSVAISPVGHYQILREVNGLVTDSLGQLWRPKYFYGGFAIHGDSYVPAVPVSHGCVRVSNEAINWIWSTNQMPIGTHFWVYN
jgi:peptidoglycan hydrolase-like protein with peptidoglycan-binding domain